MGYEPADPGRVRSFPDFVRATNQGLHADLYEIENAAFDREHLVLRAMAELAPWAGRSIVDVGCGTGYWLPIYAAEASWVVGVEPDEHLLERARSRTVGAEVLHGSAEHIPLADATVDVMHARFAYFFPPGCGPGLTEVLRVLKPGGSLVVVDNDLRHGEFADLVRRSSWASEQGTADVTDSWWAERNADRVEVMSSWTFDSRSELEAVLRMEIPSDLADPWLASNPTRRHLTYGYALFAVTKQASTR
jgi:ubiquinone/menaquinone biosynthesis C-methylase UbiE